MRLIDIITPKIDQMKKKQIKLFGKIARKIYSLNPDLMHVLPQDAEFLPYMMEDLEKIEASFINLNSEKLIIGHALAIEMSKELNFF